MASRDRRRTCAAIVVGLAAMAMGHVGARSPSAQSSRVVINEVQYDPEPSGDDSDYEWLELRNGGPGSVTMSGWPMANRTTPCRRWTWGPAST
jgi:hypothetical protein